MENKSNLRRIKLHKRENVLRFSIRKYSFGAASVVVAAFMFLSGHQAVRVEAAQISNEIVVQAIPDKEQENTSATTDLPNAADFLTTNEDEELLSKAGTSTVKNNANTEKLIEVGTNVRTAANNGQDRSAPIDTRNSRGNLGIVVANSGFITGYATPSSTIEIKKNDQTILTYKLDDTGIFKLNAPGIEVGDKVDLVVNGKNVYTVTVSQVDTVSFNDSLANIAQVDGYTATEADVEISVGGRTYLTRSQTNGYFTVNVDPALMVKDAVVTAIVTKNGKEVARGTSNVRETKSTDFGVGWNKNPMIDYSHRDVFSPDTKQYAFVSKGTADQAYDNIRVYREMRIENNGDKYYYWILDSGPQANARGGASKKISLAIPRTVGDPYEINYNSYKDGKQTNHELHPSASAWEYRNSNYRAYARNGVRRSGTATPENIISWMDYIEPSNGWRFNIYHDDKKDGTDRNKDAASRVNDMLGIAKNLRYHLVRGVMEDKLNITAGQRTIMTFKTKVLEGDELDQSIMSDWVNKDKNNPMLAEIKKRLANDPFIAYGGYTLGGYDRYLQGRNAIIGVLPLKPEEAAIYDLRPLAKEQTTKKGVIPDAINSISNTLELPIGTTYRWFKDPDVSRATAPGKPVYGKVEVIIPQRGTYIVDAPVYVLEDKAQTPVAIAKDNGDVIAKPQDPTKVDKIKVTYTGEDNASKTAVGTKGTNGEWTVDNLEVQIDPNTGEITIPADKVKDKTEVTAVTTNGNSSDSDPATAIAKAPDTQKPIITITPINQTVVEGATVTFTVTATDDQSVILNADDFLAKYFTRLTSGKATSTQVKTTETEKIVRITITTTAEDIGNQNTITFHAIDNAGNRAEPASFNFTVTPRDTIAPTITAEGATVTRNEPITPILVTAEDNPGGVGMREIDPIEVTGLPEGLTYEDGKITGTPTGPLGSSQVTIKAYDKNGNVGTKTITITVKSQVDNKDGNTDKGSNDGTDPGDQMPPTPGSQDDPTPSPNVPGASPPPFPSDPGGRGEPTPPTPSVPDAPMPPIPGGRGDQTPPSAPDVPMPPSTTPDRPGIPTPPPLGGPGNQPPSPPSPNVPGAPTPPSPSDPGGRGEPTPPTPSVPDAPMPQTPDGPGAQSPTPPTPSVPDNSMPLPPGSQDTPIPSPGGSGSPMPPAPGGDQNTPAPGGDQNTPAPGGDQNTPAPGGDQNTPAPGGDQNTPAPGGDQNIPAPGGDQNTPAPGGSGAPEAQLPLAPDGSGSPMPPTPSNPDNSMPLPPGGGEQNCSNTSQEVATHTNTRSKKILPITGTTDSTAMMVAAATSALLGFGLAGRRRKNKKV